MIANVDNHGSEQYAGYDLLFVESHRGFPDKKQVKCCFCGAPALEEPFPGDRFGTLNVTIDATKVHVNIHAFDYCSGGIPSFFDFSVVLRSGNANRSAFAIIKLCHSGAIIDTSHNFRAGGALQTGKSGNFADFQIISAALRNRVGHYFIYRDVKSVVRKQVAVEIVVNAAGDADHNE